MEFAIVIFAHQSNFVLLLIHAYINYEGGGAKKICFYSLLLAAFASLRFCWTLEVHKNPVQTFKEEEDFFGVLIFIIFNFSHHVITL